MIMKKFRIFVGKSVAFFQLMRNLSFPGSLYKLMGISSELGLVLFCYLY